MLSDKVRESRKAIANMGREEIAKAHAAGQSAYVSDGRGGIIRLDPDGTRHVNIRHA